MKTVPLAYVGTKLPFRDHLYGSGVEWREAMDVQLVPVQAAIKLIKHPEFEDAREDQSVPIKALLLEAGEETDELPETEEPPLMDVNTMTKDQIIAYVHSNFGVELPGSLKKTELVDRARQHMMRRAAY